MTKMWDDDKLEYLYENGMNYEEKIKFAQKWCEEHHKVYIAMHECFDGVLFAVEYNE